MPSLDTRPRSREAVDYLAELQRLEYESSGTSRQAERDPAIMREVAENQLLQEWMEEHPFHTTEELIEVAGDSARKPEVDARVAELEEYFLGVDGDIWSPLERPDLRRTLSELVRGVETAARARGYEIPRRPVVGTLPSGDVQAQARPGPPGEGHLVIFETGIFGFSSLVTSAAVRATGTALGGAGELPAVPEKGDITFRVTNDPSISVQFTDLLFSQAGLGSSQYATQHGMPPPLRTFAALLEPGLNSFVLAHEYAHVIHGHTEAAREGDALQWVRDDEIDADAVGLEIAAEACGLVPAYAGATLFLTGVEYVERARSLLRTGDPQVPESETHPSYGERRALLWSALQRAADRYEIHYAARLGLALYTGLRALWAVVEPVFEAGHRLGLPPPGWRPRIEYEHDGMLWALLREGIGVDPTMFGLPPVIPE